MKCAAGGGASPTPGASVGHISTDLVVPTVHVRMSPLLGSFRRAMSFGGPACPLGDTRYRQSDYRRRINQMT